MESIIINNTSATDRANDYKELGTILFYIFSGWCLPIIATFGTLGNLLSLIVLAQPQMRKNSMNILLIGLTFWDLVFVISEVLFDTVPTFLEGTEAGEQFKYYRNGWILPFMHTCN